MEKWKLESNGKELNTGVWTRRGEDRRRSLHAGDSSIVGIRPLGPEKNFFLAICYDYNYLGMPKRQCIQLFSLDLIHDSEPIMSRPCFHIAG